MGALFLIRLELWQGLHGFDEPFFVHFEDVGLSLRAAKEGWGPTFLLRQASSTELREGRIRYRQKASPTVRPSTPCTVDPFGRRTEVAITSSVSLVVPVVRIAMAAAGLSW